jgi:hypothetical protein
MADSHNLTPDIKPSRMRDAHLSPEDLDLLVESDSTKVLGRIFLHHLAICPTCHAVGGFLLHALEAGEIDEELNGLSIELSRSRFHAPALWKKLEAKKDHKARIDVVKKNRRFWSWGLAELLCQRSLGLASDEPVEAVAAAELAVEVGKRVDGDHSVQLLRGFVWAHLGHARRKSGDFPGALQAFYRAKEIWDPAFTDYGDIFEYEGRYIALMSGKE